MVAHTFHFFNGESGHLVEQKLADKTLNVSFNLAAYPEVQPTEKTTSALIKHWQAEKCSQMIQVAEQRPKLRYLRVMRIRTDTIAKYQPGEPACALPCDLLLFSDTCASGR